MKWILILMVLVNVGFAVWRVNIAAPAQPPGVVSEVLPDHVNRLLLVDELEEERLRERTVAEAPVSPASENESVTAIDLPNPETQVQGVCLSIGPLESQTDVEGVGQWLSLAGGKAELRKSERREVSRFWVYFPPLASRAEALKRVEEMVDKNIDDIYVIARGDMSNAISLGLYSRESSLDRRLEELKSKGYEASTTLRYVSKKAHWYDVEFEAGLEYPREAFAATFPELEATEKRCG